MFNFNYEREIIIGLNMYRKLPIFSILNILDFYEICFDGTDDDDLEIYVFYGKFKYKNDDSIYKIFTNIKIISDTDVLNSVMCISKRLNLLYIDLKGFTINKFKNLESCIFDNCNSLDVFMDCNYIPKLKRIELNSCLINTTLLSAVKNLESLVINSCNIKENYAYYNNKNVFKLPTKIKSLNLNCHIPIACINRMFDDNWFSNLFVLILENNVLIDPENMTIEKFPNLKKMFLHNILLNFGLWQTELMDNIEYLKIVDCQSVTDLSMNYFEFKNLKWFYLKVPKNMKVSCENWAMVGNKLEYCYLKNITDFDDKTFLSRKKFPNIKEFLIENKGSFNMTNWVISSNSVDLVIFCNTINIMIPPSKLKHINFEKPLEMLKILKRNNYIKNNIFCEKQLYNVIRNLNRDDYYCAIHIEDENNLENLQVYFILRKHSVRF
jgi:hypothetical protein